VKRFLAFFAGMGYNGRMVNVIQDILPLFGIDPAEPVRQIYKSAWDVGGSYILKRGGDLAVLEKSVRLSELLATSGVPVPEYAGKPVQSEGAYFVLMKKITGSHIDPYKGKPYKKGMTLGRLVAELHAALREIPEDFACPDADYMLQLDEYIVPEIHVPKRVLGYARAFGPLYEKLPRQLIHRDVHTGNMLFEDGVFTGWLDFDNAERNARLHDLCYLGATMLVGNYRSRRRLRVAGELPWRAARLQQNQPADGRRARGRALHVRAHRAAVRGVFLEGRARENLEKMPEYGEMAV